MRSPIHSRHTVRKGDTLERIARLEYGDAKAWPMIARANRIKRDRILIGVTLRLPPYNPAPSGRTVPPPSRSSQVASIHLPVQPPVTPPPTAISPYSAYGSFEAFSHSGKLPATGVRFPAVKVPAIIKLEPSLDTPNYRIDGSIECECLLQQEGTMTAVEIGEEGIQFSGTLSSRYKAALSNLTGEAKYAFDPLHPEKGVQFSSSLTIANAVGGKEINITQFETKVGPPIQLIYSTGPQKIQAQTQDKEFSLEGQISFRLTVTFKDNTRKDGARVPTSSSQWSTDRDWKPIIVGGAIFVGVSVLTFGWADIVAGGTAIVGAAVEIFSAESALAGTGALVLIKP